MVGRLVPNEGAKALKLLIPGVVAKPVGKMEPLLFTGEGEFVPRFAREGLRPIGGGTLMLLLLKNDNDNELLGSE
jgi:hypothetical protein